MNPLFYSLCVQTPVDVQGLSVALSTFGRKGSWERGPCQHRKSERKCLFHVCVLAAIGVAEPDPEADVLVAVDVTLESAP